MVASVGASPAVGTGGTDPAARGPVLGLDIGGTKIAVGVVDDHGSVLSYLRAPSKPERGPEESLKRLFELGRQAVADAGVDIHAVGIGCGGAPRSAARGAVRPRPL